MSNQLKHCEKHGIHYNHGCYKCYSEEQEVKRIVLLENEVWGHVQAAKEPKVAQEPELKYMEEEKEEKPDVWTAWKPPGHQRITYYGGSSSFTEPIVSSDTYFGNDRYFTNNTVRITNVSYAGDILPQEEDVSFSVPEENVPEPVPQHQEAYVVVEANFEHDGDQHFVNGFNHIGKVAYNSLLNAKSNAINRIMSMGDDFSLGDFYMRDSMNYPLVQEFMIFNGYNPDEDDISEYYYDHSISEYINWLVDNGHEDWMNHIPALVRIEKIEVH